VAGRPHQQLLHLPDPLRQCRLGDAQLERGLTEVEFLGQHGEGPEVFQLEG